MNLPVYIALRLLKSQKIISKNTKPTVKIGIIVIALSVTIMLISIFILFGFKETIKKEVIGFNSHIKIEKYYSEKTNEPFIYKDSVISDIYNSLLENKVFPYVRKTSMLKSKDFTHPVIVSGYDSAYDIKFISSKIVAGSFPNFKSETINYQILISQEIANKLDLSVGDNLVSYFFANDVKVRKLNVCGIYETKMPEFDNHHCLTDIRILQRINKWSINQISGIEIFLDDDKNIINVTEELNEKINYDLLATNIYENFPQIFNWLELQNINVKIIISLMIIIGIVNIVTIMYVILASKNKFLQITKSLGFTDKILRKTFQIHSTFIMFYGLTFGNLIALLFYFIQKNFNVIKLDPSIYFMDNVPVKINISYFICINFLIIIISFIVLNYATKVIGKSQKNIL